MTAAHNKVRNWRSDALCTQVDPDLFFPETDRGAAYEKQVADAKRVCAGCPVRQQCLDYALRSLGDGIAGGTTPDERAALRRCLGVDLEVVPVELLPLGGIRERPAAGRLAAAAGANADDLMQRFGWCGGQRIGGTPTPAAPPASPRRMWGRGVRLQPGLPSESPQHARPWQATQHWKDTDTR